MNGRTRPGCLACIRPRSVTSLAVLAPKPTSSRTLLDYWLPTCLAGPRLSGVPEAISQSCEAQLSLGCISGFAKCQKHPSEHLGQWAVLRECPTLDIDPQPALIVFDLDERSILARYRPPHEAYYPRVTCVVDCRDLVWCAEATKVSDRLEALNQARPVLHCGLSGRYSRYPHERVGARIGNEGEDHQD